LAISRTLARLAALLLALGSGSGSADTDLSFGWLMFGDLYYVPSNHSEAGDDAAGAVVRRIYMTFNGELGTHWFGRLRFEINQSGDFEDYGFEADFKDAYVGRELGRQRILLGLTSTPTFDLIEGVWGMRYLARTPMDLQGVSSRDTGIALGGPLDEGETLSYRAMVGFGSEFGNETDEGRKWMGALTWRPSPGWAIDLYGDFQKYSGPRDRTTLQAFIAYETERLRWGLQYSNQDREQDPPLEMASGFVVGKLDAALSLFLRVDRLFEPSPEGNDIAYLPYDPTVPATTLFTGAEFRLSPEIRLTPNIVYTRYDTNPDGIRPRSDLHLRVTLFLDFE
jgi:hypothetical protein